MRKFSLLQDYLAVLYFVLHLTLRSTFQLPLERQANYATPCELNSALAGPAIELSVCNCRKLMPASRSVTLAVSHRGAHQPKRILRKKAYTFSRWPFCSISPLYTVFHWSCPVQHSCHVFIYMMQAQQLAWRMWRSKQQKFEKQKLKNYMPKIKWLLYLNPFDYRHNPGLFLKVNLWGLFSNSQNDSKYYKNKVTEAQTQWK